MPLHRLGQLSPRGFICRGKRKNFAWPCNELCIIVTANYKYLGEAVCTNSKCIMIIFFPSSGVSLAVDLPFSFLLVRHSNPHALDLILRTFHL